MYFRRQRKAANDVSLSDALENDEGESGLSIQDVLYEEEDLLDQLSLKEDSRRLHACIDAVLNTREKEIITLRYGLNHQPPLPQREVAEQLHISRSYVSRLEKKALEKLRTGMEAGSSG